MSDVLKDFISIVILKKIGSMYYSYHYFVRPSKTVQILNNRVCKNRKLTKELAKF